MTAAVSNRLAPAITGARIKHREFVADLQIVQGRARLQDAKAGDGRRRDEKGLPMRWTSGKGGPRLTLVQTGPALIQQTVAWMWKLTPRGLSHEFESIARLDRWLAIRADAPTCLPALHRSLKRDQSHAMTGSIACLFVFGPVSRAGGRRADVQAFHATPMRRLSGTAAPSVTLLKNVASEHIGPGNDEKLYDETDEHGLHHFGRFDALPVGPFHEQ